MSSATTIIRTRWAAVGAAVAVSLGAGGIGITHATTDSGAGPVSAFFPIEPCRLADIRPDTIGPSATRSFDGWGITGDCDLPGDTTGLALNVTAVDATEQTNLRFFPTGAAVPDTANLNPTPGAPPTPNAVDVTLNASTGEFSVFNRFGSVAVVIDVMGYYDDHTHDDRYAPAQTEDGRVVCGPHDFDGDSSNANIKTRFSTGNTFCSLDLPTGARIRSISAVYIDESGAEFGRCTLGSTDLAIGPPGSIHGQTAATAGSSSAAQTVSTTGIVPRTVRDDRHYWLSCRLAVDVGLLAATVFYDFGSGVIIGPA